MHTEEKAKSLNKGTEVGASAEKEKSNGLKRYACHKVNRMLENAAGLECRNCRRIVECELFWDHVQANDCTEQPIANYAIEVTCQ